MGAVFAAITSYPTAIYTALLGVVMIYWMLAIIGVVDFEQSGIEVDLDHDMDLHADGTDLTSLAGYVVAFGLNGVPFSIVVSLIVLFSWLFTGLFAEYLLPLVPTEFLQVIVGTLVMVAAFCLSIPMTARVVRPLRKIFVSHNARSNHSLVGQRCKVLTQSVNENFGRAEIADGGARLNIRVWAETPNSLARGSLALIVEYDESSGHYLIEPDQNF